MSDVLIRDVPDDVLAALDANAKLMGLSRSEYIRRQLSQGARRSVGSVTVDHLRQFASDFGDLDDPDVMSQAWK
ncbi:MAG: type II toxin-antitoxin system VapB family antitoxin [Micromonosporaceae bacterium]